MRRREFLRSALGGACTAAALNSGLLLAQNQPSEPASTKPRPHSSRDGSKWRGVNLGSWLVLERWMVPDIYGDTGAPDEYGLCLALGNQAKPKLDQHRETFITDEDFRWVKKCGLNAVRLPVGYWALEAPKPYVENSRFINFALEQCRENGLTLLLDLHGAPGSQNGWDHSGRQGAMDWAKNPQNIQETLRILESFGQEYGKHPALAGIELLNEPRDQIPINVLQDFYRNAYARLRKYLDPGVAVVFHDSFRSLAWKNFMQEPGFTNVILDTHLYQCFGQKDKVRSAREQLSFALARKETLDEMQREELPTIVGEWSLSLPGHAMRDLSPLQVESVTRAYADTQLLNYEGTRGWFFWSYKMQHDSEWNFRYCVNRGWLPGNFSV